MRTSKTYQEHYTGAISELKAAQWFLSHNMQVYFPTVQQTAIDFVVDWDGFKSVQVKTATINRSSGKEYLQCRTRTTNKYEGLQPRDLYDLLVVVYREDIWVIPSNQVESSNLSLWTTKWERFKVQ